jgi:CRP-like cAMP-binding protein
MCSAPAEPLSAIAQSPIDRAITLSLEGERDAALRWAAAVVQHDPLKPSGLLLCGRLLLEAGRSDSARHALELCLRCSTDIGALPLAVAACSDLRGCCENPAAHYEAIADAFCKGSARIAKGAAGPPLLPKATAPQPLASSLAGEALFSRAAELIDAANKGWKEQLDARKGPTPLAPLPLFSELSRDSLLALVQLFEVATVPKGQQIIQEGDEGAEAYILARGALDAKKSMKGAEPIVLSHLSAGAIFGEMALLSRAPRAASIVACRPSILLVARKDTLDTVAEEHPEVGVSLAAYCRRRMIQNLVRTSAILRAVEPQERNALIDKFVTRTFEPGESLITQDNTASGLYLIASGTVTVVRGEGDERLVLSTLGPGDIVGEVSLVLRKPSTAHVIAQHPTMVLHLPREEFLAIIRQHPAVLAQLYELAVKRDEETSSVVAQETFDVDDAVLV